MPLLETTAILKSYITVSNDFIIEDLIPFKRQALREYIAPFVGDLATELAAPPIAPNIEKKTAARDLLEEVLACFSLYLGAPELSLQITGTGFNVADTTDFKQATSHQKNDFQKNLLRRGHSALDALLLKLEADKALFPAYTEELQDLQKEFIVPSAAEFGKYYNIHKSRQTYLALIPTMRRVEDQYLKTLLCPEFITAIKTTDISANENKSAAKLALQKAVVNLTVSKVVVEGQFILDQKGIHLKFDVLPHEKLVTNVNLKINDFLLKTSKELEAAGLEYIKSAGAIIIDNPEDFTECEGLIIKDKDANTGNVLISKNKRILGI